MATDRLEIYRSILRRPAKADVLEWRWRYLASNGRIMAQSSEGYRARSDALACALRVVGLPETLARWEGGWTSTTHSLIHGKIFRRWTGRQLTYMQMSDRPDGRNLELVDRR